MAFLQLDFFSRALNVASSVNVILPEPDQGIGVGASKGDRKPKVLYLLHGYSDDHSIWMRRTSVERYVSEYNIAVIMPAVNHSYYCNEAQGERYWDYISEELPNAMKGFFNISSSPEDTFAAGLSMGGYGAMKLALTYPERFSAVGCFSGVLDVADPARYEGEEKAKKERIFGPVEKIAGSENDLFYLMKKSENAPSKPKLYISCGTSDFLYGSFKKFVPEIKKHGFDVTTFEKPDETHNWRFWDEEIAKFIPFAFGS
ncbi:MAG: esterase family protein [Clostridiales bacterium]|nr:esterase family protein [Clostridiales bacterium]